MVQRSTSSDEKRSCTVPTLSLPRDISIPKHRHRRLQPHWASPPLARSPTSAQRIVAGEVNDGRLGNYAEPAAARSALSTPVSRTRTPPPGVTRF
jgi:hypothetical protein